MALSFPNKFEEKHRLFLILWFPDNLPAGNLII